MKTTKSNTYPRHTASVLSVPCKLPECSYFNHTLPALEENMTLAVTSQSFFLRLLYDYYQKQAFGK